MASIRRKEKSPFWIACFTDAAGVQKQASTKLLASKANEKAALEVADGYETAARKHQTEDQIRRTLSDIYEKTNGAPLCTYTLGDWLTEWLARIKAEVDVRTHCSYEICAGRIRALGNEMCAKMLDRVERKDVYALRTTLHETKAASTANQTLKILRGAFKRARADGVIVDNVTDGVPYVKPTPLEKEMNKKKQPFSPDQIHKLLSVADDEWRGMILAGVCTAGQRIGDISCMTARQVDLAQGLVTFTTEKTERFVSVPIVQAWRGDLAARVKGKSADAPLFPRAFAQFAAVKNGGPQNVSLGFKVLLHKAGLGENPHKKHKAGLVPGRHRQTAYSFHSFRHTATSLLKNAGVSDVIARELVGHDSVAISRVYTHIEDAPKRAAMDLATKGLNLAGKRKRKVEPVKVAA